MHWANKYCSLYMAEWLTSFLAISVLKNITSIRIWITMKVGQRFLYPWNFIIKYLINTRRWEWRTIVSPLISFLQGLFPLNSFPSLFLQHCSLYSMQRWVQPLILLKELRYTPCQYSTRTAPSKGVWVAVAFSMMSHNSSASKGGRVWTDWCYFQMHLSLSLFMCRNHVWVLPRGNERGTNLDNMCEMWLVADCHYCYHW